MSKRQESLWNINYPIRTKSSLNPEWDLYGEWKDAWKGNVGFAPHHFVRKVQENLIVRGPLWGEPNVIIIIIRSLRGCHIAPFWRPAALHNRSGTLIIVSLGRRLIAWWQTADNCRFQCCSMHLEGRFCFNNRAVYLDANLNFAISFRRRGNSHDQ